MDIQDRCIKVPGGHYSKELKEASTEALRASLKLELQNKKQCAYQPYDCSQLTLDGYKYCAKHILHDKNAPFKQCNFIYASNGKRCQLPALKVEKKDFGYCGDHALKATLTRNRQNCKYPPPETAEVILRSLSHYVKKPRTRTVSQQSDDTDRSTPDDGAELKTTKSLDPFVDVDASSVYNSACNEVLDFCSDSESDVEASAISSVWHDAQDDSSENESIDSEQEDVLKHANIYTAEEITLITRDKLIRLQSLYIEEYRHLQHLLKERRRKYLHSLKREKETCCNIYNQVRDNPKERRLFKKLKAYNRYHKTHGAEAICSQRLYDLRARITEGVLPKAYNYTKCLFSEGGVKCGQRTLPLARHCRKHILEDPNQVLFRSCGKVRADVECTTPVEAVFDDSTCRLHADIPSVKTYNQPRKDSESDYEDPIEKAMVMSGLLGNEREISSMASIKSELRDFKLPTEVPKMETLPSLLFEPSAEMENVEERQTVEVKEDDVKETRNVDMSVGDTTFNIDEGKNICYDVGMDTAIATEVTIQNYESMDFIETRASPEESQSVTEDNKIESDSKHIIGDIVSGDSGTNLDSAQTY